MVVCVPPPRASASSPPPSAAHRRRGAGPGRCLAREGLGGGGTRGPGPGEASQPRGEGEGSGPREGRAPRGRLCVPRHAACCMFFYYFLSFLYFLLLDFFAFWFGRCEPRGQREARSGRAWRRRRSGAPLLMALPRCAAGMGLARLPGAGGPRGLQVFSFVLHKLVSGLLFSSRFLFRLMGLREHRPCAGAIRLFTVVLLPFLHNLLSLFLGGQRLQT